jgi:tetratricopeptide (TPR) repeat protein
MIKLIAALLTFCILDVSVYSQDGTKDSLIKALSNNKKSDTNKVIQLLALSFAHYLSKPDTAMHLAVEALALSQKIKYVQGEASSYTCIGNVYSTVGNNAKAMEMDLKSLALHESVNNQWGIANDINSLGVDYVKRNEPVIALDYFFRSKILAERHGYKELHIILMGNIGKAYILKGEVDSARLYIQQSYELAEQIKSSRFLGEVLGLMGQTYTKSHQRSLGIEFFRSAIPFLKTTESDAALSETYLGMAKLFKVNNALDSAFMYAHNAYEISNEKGFLFENLASTEFLSSLYKERGNIDSAYVYLQLWKITSDSLFSKQRTQQLLSMDLDEKLKKRDAQITVSIALQERKKNLEYAAIAIALVTLIILFFIFSHSIIANQRLIKYMGIVSLLLVFEFLNLLLHNPLGSLTNHSPVLMLLALVALAAMLAPLHHKLEHWITHQLVEKNKRIRLAAAKKTIQQLER